MKGEGLKDRSISGRPSMIIIKIAACMERMLCDIFYCIDMRLELDVIAPLFSNMNLNAVS